MHQVVPLIVQNALIELMRDPLKPFVPEYGGEDVCVHRGF
jgi:hypothetical protein